MDCVLVGRAQRLGEGREVGKGGKDYRETVFNLCFLLTNVPLP